jgi:hypothetical protein
VRRLAFQRSAAFFTGGNPGLRGLHSGPTQQWHADNLRPASAPCKALPNQEPRTVERHVRACSLKRLPFAQRAGIEVRLQSR